jgi:WD40 repeat protein
VEGEEANKRLLAKGVYSDGRPFGSSTEGPVPMWSHDGTLFAYVAEKGTALRVETMEATGGKTIFTAAAGERMSPWPAWSPKELRLAVILNESRPSNYSIVVIDATDGKVRSRHSLPDFNPGLPPNKFRWSLDGRKILLSWVTTLVIDTETGAIERISHLPIRAEWAPDSQAVYFFNNDDLGDFFTQKLGSTNAVKLTDRAQLEAVGLTSHRWLLPGVLMSLSPQGSWLAIAGGSTRGGVGRIHIYDLRGGKTAALARPSRQFETEDVITALEWAPDENSVAVVALAKEVRIRHLDLSTGAWTTLATVPLRLRVPEIDVLGLIRTLSWAQ